MTIFSICDMYYISRGLCDHNELLYSCYNKSCDIIGDCKFCVRKALKLKSPVGQQQLYKYIYGIAKYWARFWRDYYYKVLSLGCNFWKP